MRATDRSIKENAAHSEDGYGYLMLKRVAGGYIASAFGDEEIAKSPHEIVLIVKRWLGIKDEPKEPQ